MCCPKSFDVKAWAFGCVYWTLLQYASIFVLTISFVFHPGLFSFEGYTSNAMLQTVSQMGSTMYGFICFLCFGALVIALIAFLCVYGIHKDRGGFLVPYLVVQCILTLIFVGASFFVFYFVSALDHQTMAMDTMQTMNTNLRNAGDSEIATETANLAVEKLKEFLNVYKALMVLLVLFGYWVMISPIVIVSTHCHRLMTGATSTGYTNAPLIAMEIPPAQETIMPYEYAVKSHGPV